MYGNNNTKNNNYKKYLNISNKNMTTTIVTKLIY